MMCFSNDHFDHQQHLQGEGQDTHNVGVQGYQRHTFTVLGKKVRACHAGCADSFREDRKHGLIYLAAWEVDENGNRTGKWWNREEYSVEFRSCVYCDAPA